LTKCLNYDIISTVEGNTSQIHKQEVIKMMNEMLECTATEMDEMMTELDSELTEEEIDEMYQEYLAREAINDPVKLIGCM
jgi:hypothetical protein